MCSRILGAAFLAAAACAAIVSSGCMTDGYEIAIVPVSEEMRARFAPSGSYDLAALQAAELAGEFPREHDFGALERGTLAAAAGAFTEHDFVNLGAGAVRVSIVNQAKAALHADPERPTSPLWLVARAPSTYEDWTDFQWRYSVDWLTSGRATTSSIRETVPDSRDNSALSVEMADCAVEREQLEFMPNGRYGTMYVAERVGFEIPEGGTCRVRWRFFSHEDEASFRVVFSVESGRGTTPATTELAFTGRSSDSSCLNATCPGATHELVQGQDASFAAEFPVRTLDFGHVGADHASHRLVWFRNFSDHAVRLGESRVLDLETLAPFGAESPGRYELVSTTSESVARCTPGATLEAGGICFVQLWYSGTDDATVPLDHGLFVLEYSEEGSEAVERHALWLVAQTSPAGGGADPAIDVPHLGSTRMNVARPMFEVTSVEGSGATLFSDGPDYSGRSRVACRERVPAMDCWRFETHVDGFQPAVRAFGGSVLWSIAFGSDVEFDGLDLNSGRGIEYVIPRTWFADQVESVECFDAAVTPDLATLQWGREAGAVDPLAGIFSLNLIGSGYECGGGSWFNGVFRIEFRVLPDGTPELVNVVEVP